MTPFLQDPDVTIWQGDALEVLREMPDESVHMCATSPPFWSLRDYQTGTWEGGDPECDHAVRAQTRVESSTLGGGKKNSGHQQEGYKGTCGRCGARRVDVQIGLEETVQEWVERLCDVFDEVWRVLRDDGTCWIEVGDSFTSGNRVGHGTRIGAKQGTNRASANGLDQNRPPTPEGLKAKDLVGQPWRLAFALQARGWFLRSEIIWARSPPNPMPESVTDRPTKAHSTVFLLTKKPRYYFDADAIREPYKPDDRKVTTVKGTDASEQHRDGERWPNPLGANARSVWTIPTEPTPFAHFATWPQKLVKRMILAGTSEKGCCPECGAPWVRETTDALDAEGRTTNGQKPRTPERRGFDVRMVKTTSTTGWSPTCACDINPLGGRSQIVRTPIPCTVLDPFAGSGTTALVARKHGRRSVLIELNEEYCELAAARLSQQSLFA